MWGIDLGGTKIEGVVLDPRGTVVWRDRIPTQAHLGYKHILARISELVLTMEAALGPRPKAIGIGTPGAVEPSTGRMKNCNTVCLNGRTLHSDLESTLGVRVTVANDADCFALAEATMGAGAGSRTVFGVIMGTGVGGGIVVDGRLLSGPNGIAGEWGHTILVPGGNACYCGHQGCVETYISGPSVERYHAERTGNLLPLASIVREVESDNDCRLTVEWMCGHFGQAIAQVVNIIDPDVVVMGGGAGQVPQLLTWGLDKAAKCVFNDVLRTQFRPPGLGDSAGVLGAALLSAN